MDLTKPARLFFAIALAAFGVQHFVFAFFGTGAVVGPPWGPGSPLLGYLMAAFLVAVACCIVANWRASWAANLLALVLLVRFLHVYLSGLLANIHNPGPWTSGAEMIAMCGAALVLAGSAPHLGRILYALPLIVVGVQHFLYAAFIAELIPAWVPAHLFWAYFVGAAFIAASLSILSKVQAHLAAILLGTMFFLWVFIEHAPRVAADRHNGNEWTSLFVALAMCAGAWMVAGTVSKGSKA